MNRKNKLTLHILSVVLLAFISISANSKELNELMQANFYSSDSNSDGDLSVKEFEKFIDANAEDQLGNAKKIKRFGAYKKAFRKMDSNSDGKVTLEEVKNATSK